MVLSAAVVPSAGSKEVARLFKVSMNPDGFFQEAHVKLRPVDFAADGVFLCGTESLSQAHRGDHQPGLRRGRAGGEPALSGFGHGVGAGLRGPTSDACVSCGACITACAYGAIEFATRRKGEEGRVNPVLCKGDGLCNAKCPTHAII